MPYVEEIMSIGRASNGYVLTVRVPFEGEEEQATIIREDNQKIIVCKDAEELTAKIDKLLPALTDKASADQQFGRAFKEAEYDE